MYLSGVIIRPFTDLYVSVCFCICCCQLCLLYLTIGCVGLKKRVIHVYERAQLLLRWPRTVVNRCAWDSFREKLGDKRARVLGRGQLLRRGPLRSPRVCEMSVYRWCGTTVPADRACSVSWSKVLCCIFIVLSLGCFVDLDGSPGAHHAQQPPSGPRPARHPSMVIAALVHAAAWCVHGWHLPFIGSRHSLTQAL